MRKRNCLPSLFLTAVAACNGASTPQELVNDGVAALGKSDYSGAAEYLTEALENLQPGDALYMKARLALVDSQISLDADLARDSFLGLARADPDAVDPTDYRRVGSRMTTAGKYLQAIDVVDACVQAHGESEALVDMLKAIDAASRQAGENKEVTKALAGLGYVSID